MPAPRFGNPRLDDIFCYWLSKRRGEHPPLRANIRQSELDAAVRHLKIIDEEREPGKPLQFRHRLIGTHNIEWLGRDYTSQMLDENLYGAAAPALVASFIRYVEEALPYHRRTRMDWNYQKFIPHESVELPLSDETHKVSIIPRGGVFRLAVAGDRTQEIFEPTAV